jgi:hypothetical protein
VTLQNSILNFILRVNSNVTRLGYNCSVIKTHQEHLCCLKCCLLMFFEHLDILFLYCLYQTFITKENLGKYRDISVPSRISLPILLLLEGVPYNTTETSTVHTFIVFKRHNFSFFSFVNCLLTALRLNEQIMNRCPRQHIQRYISDRS